MKNKIKISNSCSAKRLFVNCFFALIGISLLLPLNSFAEAESNLSLFLPAIISGTQHPTQENGNPDGCGPVPVTIVMNETVKIFNNTGPGIVIYGGGKVTLSRSDAHRIPYMNTCDKNQVWTTSRCQNQDHQIT